MVVADASVSGVMGLLAKRRPAAKGRTLYFEAGEFEYRRHAPAGTSISSRRRSSSRGSVHLRRSQQIHTQPAVSLFRCPEIQRDGGDVVDQRYGESVLREVDRLQIRPTGVARVNAHV